MPANHVPALESDRLTNARVIQPRSVFVGAALRGRPPFAKSPFAQRAATEGRPYDRHPRVSTISSAREAGMKRCPTCNRSYADDTLACCLEGVGGGGGGGVVWVGRHLFLLPKTDPSR